MSNGLTRTLAVAVAAGVAVALISGRAAAGDLQERFSLVLPTVPDTIGQFDALTPISELQDQPGAITANVQATSDAVDQAIASGRLDARSIVGTTVPGSGVVTPMDIQTEEIQAERELGRDVTGSAALVRARMTANRGRDAGRSDQVDIDSGGSPTTSAKEAFRETESESAARQAFTEAYRERYGS